MEPTMQGGGLALDTQPRQDLIGARTGRGQTNRLFDRERLIVELARLEAAQQGTRPITAKVMSITLALLDQAAEFWRSGPKLEPFVTASPQGEVVLEWWNAWRKITVYVGESSRDYVQVWGPDIDKQMNDGELQGGMQLTDLLKWLLRAKS
jgi:hypothetical protein